MRRSGIFNKPLVLAVVCSAMAMACNGEDPVVGDNNTSTNNTSTNNTSTNNTSTNNTATNNTSTNNTSTNNTATNNTAMCSDAETLCGDACVDTDSSVEHCGACDSPCQGGENTEAACTSGACEITCVAGYTDANGDLDDPDGDGCELECVPSNGGVEACDGEDNDCDGDVDEDFTDLGAACSVGEGACEATGTNVCNTAGDAVTCDAVAGTPTDEVCDMVDNDCDGDVDEDATDAMTYYLDADMDGYGLASASVTDCAAPMGYAAQADDCDDSAADINPAATELCDNVDNDCDTEVDEDFAMLGTLCTAGFGVCEETGNVVCNAAQDGTECNATPGAPEEATEATCDGRDNDCDTEVDEGCDDDGDGWCDEGFSVTTMTTACVGGTQTGDCDDDDGAVYPDAPGACDGKDNDCNGQIDEIQPVSTGYVSTVAYSDISDTTTETYPPAQQVAPSTDGFCAGFYDSTDTALQLTHIQADGTVESHKRTLGTGSRELMDVAWSGTRCGYLYRHTSGLYLVLWEPGTTTTDLFAVDGGDYGDRVGSGIRSAALGHELVDNFFGASPRWIIAYWVVAGDVKVRTLPSAASDNSNLTSATDGLFSATEPDVAVGPAANTNDDYMVARANTASIRVAVFNGLTGQVEASLADTAGNRVHPSFQEAAGRVFLTFQNTSNEAIYYREILSNYSYGVSGSNTYTGAASREYHGSYLLSDGLNADMPWIIDPYDDTTLELEEETTIFNFTRWAATEYDHPAFTNQGIIGPIRDHLLGIRKNGDVLEVISRSFVPFANPYDYAISEFTCY